MRKKKYIFLIIGLLFIIAFVSKVLATKKSDEVFFRETMRQAERQEEQDYQWYLQMEKQRAEEQRHKELMEQLRSRQNQQSNLLQNNQQYVPYTQTIYAPEVRREPIYIPTVDTKLQAAVNRLQLENREDLQRIQSLEKTIAELQSKVKQIESLLKIQNARNIELEKKVSLLCKVELKRRNQQSRTGIDETP